LTLFVDFGVGDGVDVGVGAGVGGVGAGVNIGVAVGAGADVGAGVVTMAIDCLAVLPKPYSAKTLMSKIQPRIARLLFD
jgi:hypothetical protein